MKKALVLAVLVAALTAPAALAASDPAGTLKTDLAKILADATVQHDTVVAAANKLIADVQAGNRDAVKADIVALQSAIGSAKDVIQTDRRAIEADLAALRSEKHRHPGLAGLLKAADQALRLQKSSVDSALALARQALTHAASAAKTAPAVRPTVPVVKPTAPAGRPNAPPVKPAAPALPEPAAAPTPAQR